MEIEIGKSDNDASPISISNDPESLETAEALPEFGKTRPGMLVSGWDDEDDDIEECRNPETTPAQEFLWAAEHGRLDIIEEYLSTDPTILTSMDKDGYTALHRASYNNQYDVALRLLVAGANPNARTEYNWTPLHSACKWNNTNVAALLIQFGADVNALSEGGQTPLHIASSISECRDIVTLLLMDDNIKPHLRNISKDTASDQARRTGKYHYLFDMADPAINTLNYKENESNDTNLL